MQQENFPIKPNQFRAFASKAVLPYVNSKFPKFFSEEEKEDIISDVTLRMWRARDSYDSNKGALSTWVGKIAKNAVFTAAEAKWRRSDISAVIEEADSDDCTYINNLKGDDYADKDILFEELQEGLFSKLRGERDQRFLAWQIDGLDAKEMAKREGISVSNVYMVLFHMRKRLRGAA